jgi:hypothetical protein
VQIKFNALLLLKELLKTCTPNIVSYTAKKFLNRLVRIANTQSPPQCLHVFNKDADPIWSTQFHYLDLETIGKWAELFKSTDPGYINYARMLKINGLLPVTEKYWNFPSNTEKDHIDQQYEPAGRIIS